MLKCKHCGCIIENYNSRLGQYCCHKCSVEYKKYNYKPNCTCPVCNKDFYIKPSVINKYKTVTCSKECGVLLKSIYMKGDKNHQYGLRFDKNSSYKGYRTKHNGYYYILEPEHPFLTEMAE